MKIRVGHLYVAAISGTLLFCIAVIASYFFTPQTLSVAQSERTLSGVGGERPNSVPFFTTDKTAKAISPSSGEGPTASVDSKITQGKFVRLTKQYVACATLVSLNSARERSGDAGLIAYYTKYHSPCVIENVGEEYFVAHVSITHGATCIADYASTHFCIWFPSEYLQVDVKRRPLMPRATGQWPVGQLNNDRLDRQAF